MILSNSTLEKILDTAGASADFAEVFCEDTQRTQITGSKDGVEKSTLGKESGVGIRVFSGLRCYYASTNDQREENLLRLAKELAALCKGKKGDRQVLGPLIDYSGDPSSATWTGEGDEEIRSGGSQQMRERDYQRKVDLIRMAAEAGMEYDPEIVRVKAHYLDEDKHILIANTEGLLAVDRQRKTRMMINVFAHYAGQIQRGFYGPGAMAGLEFYEKMDVRAAARKAAAAAKDAVHAQPCPGGVMTVVVGNGFGGLMFHEACGHSLEASSIARGNSEFCGKLGCQVASPVVTLIDDGSMPGEWGSIHMDDEGTPARRNILIENGILKSYLVDKLDGLRMGVPSTGSGRRQNYRFPPQARMTNTYIAPGKESPQEIISDTEMGLYVGNINGGSVNPVTGEFNFNTTECRLIENGKLTNCVRGATLIGTGGQVLRNVDRVGDDFLLGQGYCYNDSGAIYICAGQPTIRVQNMIVGGQAG